jgi:hypothetical protein
VNAPEVLDHQADLLVRLENPNVRKAWSHHVSLDMGIEHPVAWGGASQAQAEEVIRSSAAANIQALDHNLHDAAAYYVTKDMADLVTYSASQLEELDRISREIIPSAAGIARFEGGIPFRDVRGATLRISWLVWGPVVVGSRHIAGGGEPTEATAIWLFNDHREEPDMIGQRVEAEFPGIERLIGRWGFIATDTVYEGQRLGPAWRMPPEELTELIEEQGSIPVEFTNTNRLIHAFWLLLGQTVTDIGEAPIDRARRKRAQKMSLPPRVTIVRLRNTAGRQQPGESLVEWNHRWVVKGHWHWFHCGPNHPLAQEIEPGVYMCRRWLAPYVKGPEGKPLVITEKVYKLER